MSKSYYNTLGEAGDTYKKAEGKAKRQTDSVLAIYKHTLRAMTPAEVWEGYGFKDKNIPITSIRRAISNLEDKGQLRKTTWKRKGLYGKMNYCWIYEEETTEPQSRLF